MGPEQAAISDIPDYADPETVKKIAGEKPGENGARNDAITRSYYEIGRRLRARLGDRNADWATTAAWASGAVGLIIRREEATQSRVLRLARQLRPTLYDKLLEDVRGNLEEGNRQVYAELGLAFAELAALCCGPDSWCDEDETAFLLGLPPASRSVPVRWRDKTELGPAFRYYLEAMDLSDDDPVERKRKSELLFAANVLATVSEQAGLQPYINAAFEGIARYVSTLPFGRVPVVRGFVQVFGYSCQALTQRMVTEWGIKVIVGDDVLGVGRALTPLNGTMWAPDLMTLEDPRAKDVWDEYSRAGDDGSGSAAADWTLMEDRLNYITCFFRARQQDPRLRDEPSFLRSSAAGRAAWATRQ
jgi:hypothetical protein